VKRGFKRTGSLIRMRLSDYETGLLASLVGQLAELIEAEAGAADPDTSDPFELWQAELATSEPLDRTDPVIARLFPDAYPDDPAASAEFRRLTQTRQRTDRRDQAEVVLAALEECDGGSRPVQIPLAELDAWLKTLTALRLSLASRLGIRTADDLDGMEALGDDDPRSYVYRVYEWLAYVTESLISLQP
jgi:hypothetical protein